LIEEPEFILKFIAGKCLLQITKPNGCKGKNISASGFGRQEHCMAWLPCSAPEKHNFRKSDCRAAEING
jgi:hypothetical protein